MIVTMRARSILLAGCLLVAGCESDEAKLKRLQFEHTVARSALFTWQETAKVTPVDPDTMRAAQNRLLLAERALNRFMSGR